MGSKTSFGNTPQAVDDTLTVTQTGLTEDSLKTVFLDVMANDKGGNAKSLYSLDNSTSAGGSNPSDLLVQDTARTEAASGDASLNGARIWITSDGKVGYDASTLSASFKAQLNALSAGQFLNDTFTYAIQLGNGALSWATASVSSLASMMLRSRSLTSIPFLGEPRARLRAMFSPMILMSTFPIRTT